MAKRLPTSRQTLAGIAHHEAGHFVVGQAVGREPFDLSIVQHGDSLEEVNGAEDFYEASGALVLNPKRARAWIVGLYAGAAAQLRFGEKPALVRESASSDDAQAARILEYLASTSARAAEKKRLRIRAARLVGKHWHEIVAVAKELLEYHRIDFMHAKLVTDIVCGRTEPTTLQQYVERWEIRRTGQAAILKMANDAALAERYDCVKNILAQGRQRRIVTDNKTVTPESALEFEFADRGSERESIEVTADDIAEHREAGSHAPVTDAIVQRVLSWLRDNGCDSTSSGDGVSYCGPTEVTNVFTGEERREEFFLCNFTAQERRLVFEEISERRQDPPWGMAG